MGKLGQPGNSQSSVIYQVLRVNRSPDALLSKEMPSILKPSISSLSVHSSC